MTADDRAPKSTTEPRVRLYRAAGATLRLSVVVGWLKALLGAGAAVVIGILIDRVIAGQQPGAPLIWMTFFLLGRAALTVIPPLTAAAAATRVETDLRRRVLDAVLRTGPWSGSRTGQTVAKATQGIEAVGALAGTFLPQLVAGMSIPVLLAVVVAGIDWPTALVLILVLPLIPLLLRLLEKRFASVSSRYLETADQLAARFLDGIQGLRTLNTLDRAEAYGDALAGEAERLRAETMGLLKINQLALLAVDTLFTMGTVVAAAGMAAIRLSAGAISPGQSVAIVLLGVMLIEPLGQIGRYFYVGAIGRASARQIGELLSLGGESTPHRAHGTRLDEGAIELDSVSFTYPDGTRAIEQLSFTISPGERVALVGRSGAGKTTIAHLVLGLLQPDQGSVRVGGRAVLVPQRPFLFHGSIADNLRIAKPDATEEELRASLAAADLSELVRGRAGLETQVGERGLQLSGGEVQRLAIARVLLVDAPVVVFDEPTSSVDLESEARLRDAIRRLTADRTMLIIAHRRSTISGVDRTLIVADGRVIRDVAGAETEDILAASGGAHNWTRP
jgi:ABC-type transport system involved in cytochrome bd biosynthesis fused ATPase/permease subunit